MTVTVIHNQNLLDITIQELGSIEALFELAMDNDIAITEDLKAGDQITVLQAPVDLDIVTYYKKNNLKPATTVEIEVSTDKCNICKLFE